MMLPAWFGKAPDVPPAVGAHSAGVRGPRVTRQTPMRAESAQTSQEITTSLAADIRAGDGTAFEALFRHMLDPLVDFATALGVTREVGQDIVADIFFAIWKNRAEWSPTNATAYLFGAVRKRVHTAHQRAHRTVDLTAALENEAHVAAFIDSAVSTDAVADESDLVAQLERVLETLPPLRKAVITLRIREQLSYAEIAAILGIRENAAQAHVSRAMKAIRSAIPGLT